MANKPTAREKLRLEAQKAAPFPLNTPQDFQEELATVAEGVKAKEYSRARAVTWVMEELSERGLPATRRTQISAFFRKCGA